MVKMTLSYETDSELELAKRLLGKHIASVKVPKQQTGRFKKAYFLLKNPVAKNKEL